MNMQAGKVSLACLCRLLRLKLSSCASWQYRISTIAEMQHRSLVQTRVAAATQFARHASVQRHKIASCAALKRVAATGGAAAGGTVTAPQAPDISTSTRQEPSRVTAATVEDIKGFHKSQLHEYDYVVEDSMVEGVVPKELVGTYLRNGPGMQTAGRHTFDGDGQIVAFSFDGSGRVRFTNKFVRTRGFLDEQAAGRPVHRTAFTRGAADGSLLFNPFDMQLKNVANTGVLHWGGKLLALYESNLPYELDATSLNTYGECTMNGQLKSPVLAAHYRIMPGRQQFLQQQQQQQQSSNGNDNGHAAPVNNGNGSGKCSNGNGANGSSRNSSTAAQQPQLHAVGGPDGRTFVGFSFNAGLGSDAEILFYDFGEAGELRYSPVSYNLPGVVVALIHDIAVTPDYYVVVVGPLDFSLPKFVTQYMTSRCSIAECIEYKPQDKPTLVHLVPRPGGKAAGTLPYVISAPAMFTFHPVNAFQVPATTTTSNGNGNGSSAGSSNGGSAGSSNGSSSGRQLLVLDTVGWDEVSFENSQHNLTTDYYKGGARPELQRLVFELDPPTFQSSGSSGGSSSSGGSHSTGRCISHKRLLTRTLEFPSVNWDWHGQRHRHIYCCADTVNDSLHWGPTQAVLKVTFDDSTTADAQDRQAILQPSMHTQMWDAGRRRFVCEPLFVARPDPTAEDDGWVLAVLHNAEVNKGELVILDAQRVSEGPLATIKLPHHLCAGLHGSFSPNVLLRGWEQAAGRSWREANVVRAI